MMWAHTRVHADTHRHVYIPICQLQMCTSAYTYICRAHICIYIHTRSYTGNTYTYTHGDMYVYIHICTERERDRERGGETYLVHQICWVSLSLEPPAFPCDQGFNLGLAGGGVGGLAYGCEYACKLPLKVPHSWSSMATVYHTWVHGPYGSDRLAVSAILSCWTNSWCSTGWVV